MSLLREAFGSLSVVVPAYNAQAVIGRTVGEIGDYLRHAGLPHELIVVDDGSRDATTEHVESCGEPVRMIRFEDNRGKGAAVRAGLQAAQCAWVLFTDADHSTRIEHLERFASYAAEADVMIASRRLPKSRIVREQPSFRQSLGRTFPLLVRCIALPDFEDTQCGFKLFRRTAAHALAARQTIERFCFDVELLLIARAMGYRMVELPVDWDNPTTSSLRISCDAPQMLWDLLLLGYRAMVGAYRTD